MTAHIEKNLEKFWGHGMTKDDYDYLEECLAQWEDAYLEDAYKQMSYKTLVLIKEVCHMQNKIRLLRDRGEHVDDSVQVLFKLIECT